MGPFASPARRLAASCARSVRARAGASFGGFSEVRDGAGSLVPSSLPEFPRHRIVHPSHAVLRLAADLRIPPPRNFPLQILDGMISGTGLVATAAAPSRDARASMGLSARRDVPSRISAFRSSLAVRGFRSSAAIRAPGDYYETLGVPRSANQGDIKKAYYKLAQKYHPDKNKDDPASEKRFQEVQKAYETLKDPQSRGMYDQVGHGNYEQMENGGGGGGGGPGGFPGGQGGGFEGFPGGFRMHFGGGGPGGPGGPVDFEDLFSDFFGGGGPARDIQTTLRVTLAEVKSGTSRTVRVPETRTVDPRTGVSETHPARDVKVDLPAGVEDGQRLRVPGEGARVKGRDGRERVGSLYIDVDVVEDPRFARVGADLVTKVELSFPDAALGGTAKAPTLDGEVEVKVRKATQPGDQLRLRGRGLPELGSSRIGDLFVQFRLKVPKDLSDRQRELLEEFAEEENRKNGRGGERIGANDDAEHA